MPDMETSSTLTQAFLVTLNQIDGLHAFCTALGDVLITGWSVYCDPAAAAPLTNAGIKSNDTTPFELMTDAEGAVANLKAQCNVKSGILLFILKSGRTLQLNITGGASATGVLTVVIRWRPLSGNGLLV